MFALILNISELGVIDAFRSVYFDSFLGHTPCQNRDLYQFIELLEVIFDLFEYAFLTLCANIE